MAKNNMKLKYKQPKREKKNNKETIDNNDFKTIIKTILIVVISIGVLYLCVIGMEKLGLFQVGYTKPESEDVSIDYEFIDIGTIFNRDLDTYYVLFDNYKSDYTKNSYINTLISNQDEKVYKVDMSLEKNKKYISEDGEGNFKVQNVNDLKINGITLIKISKSKNVKYIEGSSDIEEYLE